MGKHIFVINGTGRAGKDTFVKFVSGYVPSVNFSSVDEVKKLLLLLAGQVLKQKRTGNFYLI